MTHQAPRRLRKSKLQPGNHNTESGVRRPKWKVFVTALHPEEIERIPAGLRARVLAAIAGLARAGIPLQGGGGLLGWGAAGPESVRDGDSCQDEGGGEAGHQCGCEHESGPGDDQHEQ